MKKIIKTIIKMLVLTPAFVFAHGDEAAEKPQATTKNYFTVSESSDVFELVLRYKHIEPGKSTGLTIFLSDFETNAAVDSAEISVASSDDSNLKFKVSRKEKGQYDVDANFPEKKNYSLVFTIQKGDKNDLILISPVEVGKELPAAVDEKDEAQKSSLQWWWLPVAFGGGCLLVYFFLNGKIKKLSREGKIAVIISVSLLSVPLNIYNKAFAHNEPSFAAKGGMSDEIEIGKESQFLFNVLTANPTYSDYSSQLQLNGVVKPSTNGYAQIVSPHNGKIVALNVSIGQRVSKGQTLATIEQTQSSAEQISLGTNKANAAAEYESAKKEYDRLQTLKDIVSQKDLQNAEIRYNNAVANKKSYEQLSGNLSLTYALHSPIDGVVDNFNLTVGQQVEQTETLMNVYNTKTLNVEATLFASDVKKISGNAVFSVMSSDENANTASAKMIAVNQSFNPINQSSTLVLKIENNTTFLPGQAVHIHMMKKSPAPVMVIPGSAISYVNGKPAVFVHHQPEEFKIIYVETGNQNISGTEILKGLTEDDRVIVNGTYEVKSIFQNQ